MNTSAIKRLTKEFSAMKQTDEYEVELVDSSVQRWKAAINGPAGSPYAGGKFKLAFNFPNEYPFRPPRVQFLTKVWHPNVSHTSGAICFSLFDRNWSPSWTVKGVCSALEELLVTPEEEEAMVENDKLAECMRTDLARYNNVVRYWVKAYAAITPMAELIALFPNEEAMIQRAIDKKHGSRSKIICKLSDANFVYDNAFHDI